MDRRQFLLTTSGIATGFILPSFFDKAFDLAEKFGEPFIVKPKDISKELFVCDPGLGELELNLGDPCAQPPTMTYREYIERYWDGDIETWLEDREPDFVLDDEMDLLEMIDAWCRTDSSNAKAHRLLVNLDLGRDFDSPDAIGELQFFNGMCPVNDYLDVHAKDLVSVSLLQERLNQLGTGIHVRMW